MELSIGYTAIFFLAPDVFDPRVGYPKDPQTDYEEQTRSRNRIRNKIINAKRRVVCYDQPIYNDARLELTEYAGLQLDIRNASIGVVSVQEQYDNAAIQILDDDGQLLLQTFCVYFHSSKHRASTYKYFCNTR